MTVLFILLISCSFCDGSSLSVVFLLLVPLFLLCFYLLLASSFLSGGCLHPPALSVGCLSILIGRLCPSAIAVHRSSSSIVHVCSTTVEPSLGHFWTVSWKSFGLMAIIWPCLSPRLVSRPCQGRHSVAAQTCLFPVRSLFGRHSADCLFAGCPSVLSLPSGHLSIVSRLYSQPQSRSSISAVRLGRASRSCILAVFSAVLSVEHLSHALDCSSWPHLSRFVHALGHASWLCLSADWPSAASQLCVSAMLWATRLGHAQGHASRPYSFPPHVFYGWG